MSARVPDPSLVSAPTPEISAALVCAKVDTLKEALAAKAKLFPTLRLVSARRNALLEATVTVPDPSAKLLLSASVPAFRSVPPE